MENTRNTIKRAALVAVLMAIVSYVYFQAHTLLTGPHIIVHSPQDGSAVSTARVTIEGVAENVSDVALNNRYIFIDEKGHFSEMLLLAYGYNIIELTAHDRFGRSTHKQLELVYK